jgi:hypothetical protein
MAAQQTIVEVPLTPEPALTFSLSRFVKKESTVVETLASVPRTDSKKPAGMYVS